MSELIGWHEVAIGAISLLLVVAGWAWTITVSAVKDLKRDFATHVVQDTKSFGELTTLIEKKHIELLKELRI